MTGIDSDMFERAVEAERKRSRTNRLVAAGMGTLLLTPIGFVAARMIGIGSGARLIAAPAIALGMVVLAFATVKAVQWFSARVFMSFVQPGGSGRAPMAHSRAEALAAAGRIEEAREEFDAARGAEGSSGDIASLRAEAELNTTAAGDPRRAEQLLLRLRRAPDATPNDELYASHRLIDLYMGPLADSGRVMVELRRMADRFPDTVDGRGALAALKRRKDEQGG